MTPKKAAEEIRILFKELERLGARAPSAELRSFVESLAARNGVNAQLSKRAESSSGTRVAKRRRKDPDAMAKTIEQIADKLRANFMSDTNFEAAMSEATECGLTRDNVVQLYNKLFDTERKFGKSVTKPDLFNAIRRDRIARVRARS